MFKAHKTGLFVQEEPMDWMRMRVLWDISQKVVAFYIFEGKN